MNYKKILSLDEKIDYLYENKRVRFNKINENEAKEILLYNNYINVITPFKDKICKNGIKDKKINKHIYDKETEFKEYYDYFCDEREKSRRMLLNILDFERKFNAIFSYHSLQYYKIESNDDFKKYIDKLKNRSYQGIFNKNIKTNEQSKKIEEHIDGFVSDFYKYNSIFIAFDRLLFGTLKDIYICSELEVQEKIFNDLKRNNLTFGTTNVDNFIDKLFNIVGIRNVLAHNNSLNIYVKYYNIRNKELRRNNKSILSIIKELDK